MKLSFVSIPKRYFHVCCIYTSKSFSTKNWRFRLKCLFESAIHNFYPRLCSYSRRAHTDRSFFNERLGWCTQYCFDIIVNYIYANWSCVWQKSWFFHLQKWYCRYIDTLPSVWINDSSRNWSIVQLTFSSIFQLWNFMLR